MYMGDLIDPLPRDLLHSFQMSLFCVNPVPHFALLCAFTVHVYSHDPLI